VDNNLHPWLIEMNISPSLHSSTSLDANVKAPLAKDTLNMAGIPFPIRLKNTLNFVEYLSFPALMMNSSKHLSIFEQEICKTIKTKST
jgi:hypothetical protein